MIVEVDAEFAGDFIFNHDGVAEQAADDGTAQALPVRKLIAPHSREAAFGDGLLPGRDVAIVLRVGVLNAANGGDAHAVEVGARFSGIALKIAMQSSVLFRDG